MTTQQTSDIKTKDHEFESQELIVSEELLEFYNAAQ